MKKTVFTLTALSLFSASLALAQTPPVATVSTPAANTPLGTGPYKAIMEMDPTLAKHTVYRPNDMNAIGSTKLPILAWGNGGCNADGNAFRRFLTEIASHGYLAIASGDIGPASVEAQPAPPAPRPADAAPAAAPGGLPKTTTSQLIEAIDWAIAENSRPGSKFYGKLDTTKIALAGQSCGGVQAIEASVDPRIKTIIVGNSGLMEKPTTMTGQPVPKESLKLMHAPVLYMSGDEKDQAFPNANDDFEKINHLPIFRAYQKGVGHSGTYRTTEASSFAKVAIAWLDWQLKANAEAAKMFVGEQCGLCVNPDWVTRKKKID